MRDTPQTRGVGVFNDGGDDPQSSIEELVDKMTITERLASRGLSVGGGGLDFEKSVMMVLIVLTVVGNAWFWVVSEASEGKAPLTKLHVKMAVSAIGAVTVWVIIVVIVGVVVTVTVLEISPASGFVFPRSHEISSIRGEKRVQPIPSLEETDTMGLIFK